MFIVYNLVYLNLSFKCNMRLHRLFLKPHKHFIWSLCTTFALLTQTLGGND